MILFNNTTNAINNDIHKYKVPSMGFYFDDFFLLPIV